MFSLDLWWLELLSDAFVFSNLFAIDYLKEHPATTKPEFKKIWDDIASETKKVCKQHYHAPGMCSSLPRNTKRWARNGNWLPVSLPPLQMVQTPVDWLKLRWYLVLVLNWFDSSCISLSRVQEISTWKRRQVAEKVEWFWWAQIRSEELGHGL